MPVCQREEMRLSPAVISLVPLSSEVSRGTAPGERVEIRKADALGLWGSGFKSQSHPSYLCEPGYDTEPPLSLSFSLCEMGTRNLPHGAVMRTKWDHPRGAYKRARRHQYRLNGWWSIQKGCSHGHTSSPPSPPSGDVGILRVPVAGGLQRLLPPGCTGLLLFAHRDQGPRAAGIQPPGVGPGDGGPRGARHRRHQVELGLSGVVTSAGG